MHSTQLIIFSVLIVLINLQYTWSLCNTTQDFYQSYLGTRTPYRFVGNTDDTPLTFPGCSPKKIWTIARHGTRNPNAKIITKMNERLPKIRDLVLEYNTVANGKLRNSDLDGLREWKKTLEESEEKKLTHEGEDEMIAFGERMQARFPQLFSPIYSNTSYFFKYTNSQRTMASARYFATGLFGRRTAAGVRYPLPLDADPILRFYKLCSKWIEEVKDNPETDKEKVEFERSSYVSSAVKSVNKALNLTNHLSTEDVQIIHTTCAFETAWHKNKRSPWCSLLTDEAFEVAAYLEDLTNYYEDGYGYELTYSQACPPIKDFIEFFDNSQEYPKAITYFTHSGTLLKLLAHVGLYKDPEPLTASQYKKVDYKWKTSSIGTFGTNLAFALYDCHGKQHVVTLHQEHVVRLPGCDQELCEFDTIKQIFKQSIECPFEEMCSLE